MAINATYKIWNGSDWIEYHFYTNAGQVANTTGNGWKKFVSAKVKVNGQPFSEGSETGSAQVTINGSHIVGNATPVSGYSLVNISANDTVAAALGILDRQIEVAKSSIPPDCLTEDNYGDTLGSVYQAKDDDLTAIAALTGTGFLKRTGNNTWSLDSNVVPTSRTINGKALSSNVTLAASDIGYTNGSMLLVSNIGDALDVLVNRIQGKHDVYAIDNDATGTGVINSQLDTQDDVSIDATFTVNGSYVTTGKYIKTVGGTSVDIATLKVGDTVYITDTKVPDRWVSEITYPELGGVGHVTFAVLETQKVNLSWSSITGKPTLSISNGTITIGSESITPLTEHQDISGKAPNNHASANTTYGIGTSTNYGHVKLGSANQNGATAADGVAAPNGHTHSQYLTSHQSLNEYPKIFVQNAQPTASKSGDLWIQVPAS